ncbi:MAG TPA: Fe2+-enterobactin ABC transporter substrate-binding protein [Cellulomonas sp.]
MHAPFRRSAAIFAVPVALVLALGACSSDSSGTADATGSSSTATDDDTGTWPRTIEHAAGTTEIDEQPVRIVSTSPSITGSLLAIDAPVVATASAVVSNLTDDQGFFSQWADLADERGVEVLYTDLTLDLDAVDSFAPDLIIGSANGGDSTLDSYDQLSEIAPTVLLDYSSTDWQSLTAELGDILGLEDEAAQVTSDYDTWVTEQATQIEAPEGSVTALVYLGADGVWAYTSDSPQGILLTSLGFDYADVPEDSATLSSSVAMVSAENMPTALADFQTIFVIPISSEDEVDSFAADALVSSVPAVADDQVLSLGGAAFRLDYFSAMETVEALVAEFGA